MSTEGNHHWSDDEDVIGRADALLNKHRAAAAKPAADPNAIPTLTEAVDTGADAAAIPTLTDIVAAEAPAAAPEPAVAPPVCEPDASTAADDAGQALMPTPGQSGGV